ncbi:glycosyltransferase family 2 protein [Tunicatimonas pelagia]|uniref:glycosyltransferase family 2 protein n=1 Tax=Tunicatimonas pelagia TaxID=931531 RepID=UPI002665A6CC|nr:glycosyltransferase family 2 protein [Tunicatimonas pelagia]WKN44637.1 glycosyltransferase family 2 protein [Tunicatimonas pelagia]
MEKYDLTIAIVNYNTRDLLESCLATIFSQTKGVSFQIIVVDNASRDDSVAMLNEHFPQVNVIQNEKNVGFPSAVNQAMIIADSRYFLLFNSDAKPLNNAFEVMINYMDQHPKAGICGPQLYYPDGAPQKSHYRFRFPRGRATWEVIPRINKLKALLQGNTDYEYHFNRKPAIVPNEPQVIQWPRGVCFMIRSKCIEDVGLMDPNIFIYADEVDYAWRARKRGWERHLVPDAKVSHEEGASTKKNASLMNIIHVQSDYYYFYKHFGIRGWLYLRIGYFAGSLMALLLGVVSSFYGRLRAEGVPRQHFTDFRDLLMLSTLTSKVLPPDAR